MRASEALDLPLGTVLQCHEGHVWVFVGWASTSEGSSAYFVRSMSGRRIAPTSLWTYSASQLDTLLRKFPDLEKFRRAV